ncbi:hypothetical protein Ndes2526B_g05656 [Nannochloris sp. 'desiccata']
MMSLSATTGAVQREDYLMGILQMHGSMGFLITSYGRVDDINAPPAVFTTGQRRMLKLPPPPPPPPRQRKTHHNSNAHHRNKA